MAIRSNSNDGSFVVLSTPWVECSKSSALEISFAADLESELSNGTGPLWIKAERSQGMDAIELMAETGRTLTAKRVFGEPYEKDGVTIIPAATVGGGGGSGIG